MFQEQYNLLNWDALKESIYSKTAVDVEVALHKSKRNLEDFKALK